MIHPENHLSASEEVGQPPYTLVQLALDLFDVGAVKSKLQSEGGLGFKLKLHEKQPDAPLSPFYLNLRTFDNPKPGPLTPELVQKIGEQLFDLAESLGIEYTCVAGLPNAGDPFAEAFVLAAEAKGKTPHLLKLVKHVGEEGNRTITEIASGEYETGDIVLVIDDLVTKAETKVEAIAVLEEHQLFVYDILVLVDREQGGADQLQEEGYDLHACFTISWLLGFYLEKGRIDQATHDEIVTYLQSA